MQNRESAAEAVDDASLHLSPHIVADQELGPAHHAVIQPEEDEIARIEAERREIEVERRKERESLVPGLDDEDLNALLQLFDKVGGRFDPHHTLKTCSKSSMSTSNPLYDTTLTYTDWTSSHHWTKILTSTNSGAASNAFTLHSSSDSVELLWRSKGFANGKETEGERPLLSW